ncbi:unnamed protein product [Prorocentrum cordatum]|uniref:Uncharacterized protein n=1 Tax=Prorocentrum cordatum TaxID=2364126 RepID=A0ABN9VI58_9DINO|nr:unnamed protein product [Polarella glacialis]
MFSPRAMFQDGGAALAEQGKCKAVCPESGGLSSAPTRCPTAELCAFGDDQDADAFEEILGATASPKDGDEPALLEAVLRQTAALGDGHPGRGPAMLAPRGAPARVAAPPRGAPGRLRSVAYWEQRAAAARQTVGSPWELGVRQRRPRHEEDRLGLGAAPRAPAGGAGNEGAADSPSSWAGAVSRELRRGARWQSAPPAPPPGSPSAALGAALRSRGRSYYPAGSR